MREEPQEASGEQGPVGKGEEYRAANSGGKWAVGSPGQVFSTGTA